MQTATDCTMKINDRLEDLIERGRRLHDQAIVDFCVRWVPAALRAMTGNDAKGPEAISAGHRQRLPLKHSPQVPA